MEDITVALGRESWLFVIAGPSAQAALVNGDDLPAIAAKLGIRYALKSSSVRVDGDDVILVAQLADAAGGVQLWSSASRPTRQRVRPAGKADDQGRGDDCAGT